MASGAAKRYTEAVFDIAREKGSFDQWQQDLDALAGLMSDDGAALVLNSPKISRAQKMSLIQEALRGAQPEALNLATLLLDRGRLGIAPEMARAVPRCRALRARDRRRQGDHGGADRPADRGRHPAAPELPGREAGGDPSPRSIPRSSAALSPGSATSSSMAAFPISCAACALGWKPEHRLTVLVATDPLVEGCSQAG